MTSISFLSFLFVFKSKLLVSPLLNPLFTFVFLFLSKEMPISNVLV